MTRSKQSPAMRGRVSRTMNTTPLQTAKKTVNGIERISSVVCTSRTRGINQYNCAQEPSINVRKPVAPKKMPPSKAQSPRKRTRRSNETTPALREISMLQETKTLLIPKAPIYRLVREIMQNMTSNRETKRITPDALNALHEASEAFLIGMFEQSNMLAMHGKRETIMVKDVTLWKKLHRLPV
uniref:Histone domain-containing protein n=1 Tax=Rhabditophanes sp. KR3021 TaxID=114890 RepID=A0AC35U995_9BILA